MMCPPRALRLCSALLASVILCWSASVHAKTQTFSEQSDDAIDQYILCANKTDGFDRNDVMCTQDELNRQAKILDQAYRAYLERIDARQRRLLMRSQHAWKEDKDRTCHVGQFLEQELPGTLEIIETKSCLATEMSGRIRWLEEKYDNKQR